MEKKQLTLAIYQNPGQCKGWQKFKSAVEVIKTKSVLEYWQKALQRVLQFKQGKENPFETVRICRKLWFAIKNCFLAKIRAMKWEAVPDLPLHILELALRAELKELTKGVTNPCPDYINWYEHRDMRRTTFFHTLFAIKLCYVYGQKSLLPLFSFETDLEKHWSKMELEYGFSTPSVTEKMTSAENSPEREIPGSPLQPEVVPGVKGYMEREWDLHFAQYVPLRISEWQHMLTCQDESSQDAATEPYKDTSLSPNLPLVPTTKTEDVDSDEEFEKKFGLPNRKRARAKSPLPLTGLPVWQLCGLLEDPDASSNDGHVANAGTPLTDATRDMVTDCFVDPYELALPHDSDDVDSPHEGAPDKSDADSTGTLEYDLPPPVTPVEQPNEKP